MAVAGTITSISAYVASGSGQIKVAVYNGWTLKGYSAAQNTVAGWNTVTFSSGDVPAGSNWLAVKVNGTARLAYSREGADKFQYSVWKSWPNPAMPTSFLGNAAIRGNYCHF